jgi:hypothetical protein
LVMNSHSLQSWFLEASAFIYYQLPELYCLINPSQFAQLLMKWHQFYLDWFLSHGLDCRSWWAQAAGGRAWILDSCLKVDEAVSWLNFFFCSSASRSSRIQVVLTCVLTTSPRRLSSTPKHD